MTPPTPKLAVCEPCEHIIPISFLIRRDEQRCCPECKAPVVGPYPQYSDDTGVAGIPQ